MIKPWKERQLPDGICLQRDSLDLYVDDVLSDSAPISPSGMERLRGKVDDVMHSGMLFQIKIRNSVQWESRPTQIDLEPNQFSYEVSVL